MASSAFNASTLAWSSVPGDGFKSGSVGHLVDEHVLRCEPLLGAVTGSTLTLPSTVVSSTMAVVPEPP